MAETTMSKVKRFLWTTLDEVLALPLLVLIPVFMALTPTPEPENRSGD
jgi:hypothetical protein